MGVRDWWKRRREKKEETTTTTKPTTTTTETFGLPAPKETVLTKIVKESKTQDSTRTDGISSKDTGFSSRGTSFTTKPTTTTTETFGLPAPKETVLTKAARETKKLTPGKPVEYDPSGRLRVEGFESREYTGTEPIIKAEPEVRERTQWQKELLEKPSLTPRFGTIGFGDNGMVSLGEIQRERELKRFDIERKYQEEIQKQFEISGLGVEEFLETPESKQITTKAQKQFEATKDIPGLYSEPSFDSGIKSIPIIGTAIEFKEKAGEFIESEARWGRVGRTTKKEKEERSPEEVVELYSTIYEGRDTRSEKALSAMFSGGILATEIVPIAGFGAKVGRTALEKQLAKEISIGAEQLGKAQIVSGGVVDIGSGKFAQQFVQRAGVFERRGFLGGIVEEGATGLQFIPSGKGAAVGFGKAELTGVKKSAAKLLGAETEKVFAEKQLFDIGSAQVTRTGGEAFGFEVSRGFGTGVFTPTKTITGIGGRRGAIIETRIGDTAITTGFETPAFTKRFPKGAITYTEIPEAKGLQFAVDIETIKPPKTSIQTFEKDLTKVKAGRESFLDTIKKPTIETKTLPPKIEAPIKKNGLVLETPEIKAITQKIEAPQITETLQRGFARTGYKPTPFQFAKTPIPKFALGATAIGIGAREISNELTLGKVPAISTGKLQTPKLDTGVTQRLGDLQKLDVGTITPVPRIPTPITPTFGGGIPEVTRPFIPGFKLPSLQLGKSPGVGKLSGKFVPRYTESFAGYALGLVGKTKGIKIGTREIFTGLEIRGKVKKKKKTSKKKK